LHEARVMYPSPRTYTGFLGFHLRLYSDACCGRLKIGEKVSKSSVVGFRF